MIFCFSVERKGVWPLQVLMETHSFPHLSHCNILIFLMTEDRLKALNLLQYMEQSLLINETDDGDKIKGSSVV